MRISGRTAASIAASARAASPRRQARRRRCRCPPFETWPPRCNVSPATVAAAYKLLRARGLVAGRGRARHTRGGGPVAPAPADVPTGSGGRRRPRDRQPDPALLPPVGPALRAIEHEVRLYGERADRGGLAAFASAEFEADGIPARAVTVLSGAMDAIERVLREHLRPGDGVALEDPSFPASIDLVAASGYAAMPFGAGRGRSAARCAARGPRQRLPRRHRHAASAEPDRRGAERRRARPN